MKIRFYNQYANIVSKLEELAKSRQFYRSVRYMFIETELLEHEEMHPVLFKYYAIHELSVRSNGRAKAPRDIKMVKTSLDFMSGVGIEWHWYFSQRPYRAVRFARNALNHQLLRVLGNARTSRFYLGEPIIAANPHAAMTYMLDIHRAPWPEAEPALLQSPEIALKYMTTIIHRIWPEAIPVIAKDFYLTEKLIELQYEKPDLFRLTDEQREFLFNAMAEQEKQRENLYKDTENKAIESVYDYFRKGQ